MEAEVVARGDMGKLSLLLITFLGAFAFASDPSTQPSQFPSSWLGRWVGECSAFSPAGKTMTFQMELSIEPTAKADVFRWVITYIDSGRRQVRDYSLIAVEPARGRWKIDEGNSIVLPATMVGDTLISPFDVQGARLTAMYRILDDTVEFTIVTTPDKPSKTGGEGAAPEVVGFEAAGLQRAVLKRQQ